MGCKPAHPIVAEDFAPHIPLNGREIVPSPFRGMWGREGQIGLVQIAMTRTKICGIQEASHALEAACAGAEVLGLVFVPGRRRRVDEDQALRIISALREEIDLPTKVVGLFANQPVEDVNRAIERCGLDMVQLSGGESLDYCGQLAAPVIRVLHVADSMPLEDTAASLSRDMEESIERGYMLTLDRKVDGLVGGSGLSFNWDIAEVLSGRGFDFFLAGGLTPENVGHAIRQVRPWGVDVSSGVETGGVKDGKKIRDFIDLVRAEEEVHGRR